MFNLKRPSESKESSGGSTRMNPPLKMQQIRPPMGGGLPSGGLNTQRVPGGSSSSSAGNSVIQRPAPPGALSSGSLNSQRPPGGSSSSSAGNSAPQLPVLPGSSSVSGTGATGGNVVQHSAPGGSSSSSAGVPAVNLNAGGANDNANNNEVDEESSEEASDAQAVRMVVELTQKEKDAIIQENVPEIKKKLVELYRERARSRWFTMREKNSGRLAKGLARQISQLRVGLRLKETQDELDSALIG